MMEPFLQDLRFAIRLVWKDRGFSLAAILTLALCIGGNAAIFTVVQSVLLRPLPTPRPDALVLIYDSYPRAGVERGGGAVPFYYDLLAQADVFEQIAMYNTQGQTVGGGTVPERLTGMQVTPSFFRLLGAQAEVGRTFTDEEAEPDQSRRVILSYGLWQRMFKGDPALVGRDLRLNGAPYTVVGIMPAQFQFLDPTVRLWTPLAFSADQRKPEQRHSHSWEMVARLKPGATVQRAQEQINAVNAREMDQMPGFKPILENAGFQTHVVPFQADLVRNVRAVLYLLWGGALFVLLIGAVNITNLVLVRSSVRLKELATRAALGAGLGRIGRQLVTEMLLLTLAGGALGLALGYWGLGLLKALGLEQMPRVGEIRVDATVVLFVLGLAIAVGVALGLAPLVAVGRMSVSQVLREEGRGGTATAGARLTRRVLVTAQVAIACVLLVGAGLLLASFQAILAVNPGFVVQGTITGSINPPRAQYADAAALRPLVERSLTAIRALPGVTAAGVTSSIPFGDSFSDSVILAEGYVMAPGESLISPSSIIASPGYFEAMQIPLRRGRLFDARDAADAPKVVVIDERLAKKFWPDKDPIGRRLYYPESPKDLLAIGPKTRYFTVVGVVGTIKDRGLVDADDRVGAYYFPYAQSPQRYLTFAIRTSGDPAQVVGGVRRVLAGIDPELPLFDVRTMAERVEQSLERRRTPMILAVSFAMVALLLAGVGIYGVLAYQVRQRTREIGIRLALGSTRQRVFQLILREGLLVTGVGLATGLAGAIALRRVLEAQLYGVGPFDPTVLSLVLLVLAMVALAACAAPASVATRIDPIVALTRE